MARRQSRQGTENKPSAITADDMIKSGYTGAAGDASPEKLPIFNKLNSEKSYFHQDSYIVLGRDRNNSDISGYGGAGHAAAHSIDIVVGRCAMNPEVGKKIRQQTKEKGQTASLYVDPDFENDAARIYISQKADIDKYFNLNNPLGNGTIGESKGESAIGIKADSLRMMSRKGIKLVAAVDHNDSRGFDVNDRKGVDLISLPLSDKKCYDETEIIRDLKNNMQPIPKGDNLAKALEDLAKQLDVLSGLFINYVEIQGKYNNIVATHTHISPFYAITVPPSLDLIPANVELNISVFSETIADTLEFKMAYLNKFKNDYLSATSETYINSRYHHLN